jgi:hypothetical protein
MKGDDDHIIRLSTRCSCAGTAGGRDCPGGVWMYYENQKTLIDYIRIAFAVCPATRHLTHNQATSIENSDCNYISLYRYCCFIVYA